MIAFKSYPNIALIYPDYELINNHGRVIKTVFAPTFNQNDLLVKCLCAPGPGAFFKKTDFDKTTGWDSNLSFVPDWEFWLRLNQFGDFKRLEKVLAQFRVP